MVCGSSRPISLFTVRCRDDFPKLGQIQVDQQIGARLRRRAAFMSHPLVVEVRTSDMVDTMRHLYGFVLIAILIVLMFSPTWVPRLRADLVQHFAAIVDHVPIINGQQAPAGKAVPDA